MVAGIGNRCLKYLMFLVNFLIFLIGAIIFGMSLWITIDKDFGERIRKFVESTKIEISSEVIDYLAKYQAALWLFVAVGGFLMVVGFLGCCGAGCESVFMLTLFFIVVLVLAAIQMFGLFYIYSGHDEQFNKALHEVFEKSSATPESRKQLMPIQNAFSCCGATKETKEEYIAENVCTAEQQTYDDCYTVVKNMIENSSSNILLFGVLLLVIEAFALVFSCILTRAFREEELIPYSTYY